MRIETKISKKYPKDDILSYKVTIVKTDTIKKLSDKYIYDVYIFNGITEYNQWLIQKKDEEIQLLKNKIKEIENQNIKERIDNQDVLINDLSQTINELNNSKN